MASDAALVVVRALLASGDVTSEDLILLATEGGLPVTPSHREFVPLVRGLLSPGTARTYGTGLRRLADVFAARPLNSVNSGEIEVMAADIRREANSRGLPDGTGAARNFIHAARFFYRTAQQHGYTSSNPALDVRMPGGHRHVRRALTEVELSDVYRVAAGTGDDPVLDVLLLDFHRETAARRGGACALRTIDLRSDRPSIMLREKGGHEREIPVSPDLVIRLDTLAQSRADDGGDNVFRYRDGSPLTGRRYDSLFKRVKDELPWARRLGVSMHWIRHTTLTDISNAAGSRIAAAYAGHAERSVTDRYTVPSFEDLLVAHSTVFPHAAS